LFDLEAKRVARAVRNINSYAPIMGLVSFDFGLSCFDSIEKVKVSFVILWLLKNRELPLNRAIIF